MRYDFDKMTDRRGTGSLKWDVPERELPMWVADMDFETAPEIREALRRRVEHGVFGYNVVTRDWYEAYQGWWGRRHHLEMEQDWLVFCTGVVPAISSAVRKLTTVGENVLVQTPVYNIFFNSIRNNGRNILESPLVYDGGEYSIDFGDLEEKLADPQTTLMLLCNPHNPVGKIWDRETLARIGELCARHHVLVLSDEIHCDLTDPGYEYVPFAAVSDVCRDNSVTCLAPTKAFNLAGLQTAAVMVPDSVIRHKLERGLNTDEVAEPNSFAVGAAVAASREGALAGGAAGVPCGEQALCAPFHGGASAGDQGGALPGHLSAVAGLRQPHGGRGGADRFHPAGQRPVPDGGGGVRSLREAFHPAEPGLSQRAAAGRPGAAEDRPGALEEAVR